jgi:pyridoxamine 5'-phosphate oxidase family protein
MSAFTEKERQYLGERRPERLGRIATVGADGTPHVVPVGWSFNAEHDSIDVGGMNFAQTKKFKDARRSGRASIVVDDLVSVDPWQPRGIEVRGRAETLEEPRALIRIHPERIISWGIEAEDSTRRHARSVETARA